MAKGNFEDRLKEKFIPAIYKSPTRGHISNLIYIVVKIIGDNIHTSVYDKRDDFGFPIVN